MGSSFEKVVCTRAVSVAPNLAGCSRVTAPLSAAARSLPPVPLSPPVRLSQVLGIFFASPSVNVSEGQQSSLFCGVATLYWSITAALCLLQTGGRGVSGAASGGGRGVERGGERGGEGWRGEARKVIEAVFPLVPPLLSSSFFAEPLYDSRPPTTRAL